MTISSIKGWTLNPANIRVGTKAPFCAWLTLSNGAITAGSDNVTSARSAYCDSVGKSLYNVRYTTVADSRRRWPRAVLTLALR